MNDIREIVSEFRATSDYRYDPWGSAIGAAFAAADVLWTLYGVQAEHYRPSPMHHPGDTERIYGEDAEPLAPFLADYPQEAVERAYTVFSRYADVCKSAGRSY